MLFLLFAAWLAPARHVSAGPPEDGKLRVIVFGGHPDDPEYKTGGTAAALPTI